MSVVFGTSVEVKGMYIALRRSKRRDEKPEAASTHFQDCHTTGPEYLLISEGIYVYLKKSTPVT